MQDTCCENPVLYSLSNLPSSAMCIFVTFFMQVYLLINFLLQHQNRFLLLIFVLSVITRTKNAINDCFVCWDHYSWLAVRVLPTDQAAEPVHQASAGRLPQRHHVPCSLRHMMQHPDIPACSRHWQSGEHQTAAYRMKGSLHEKGEDMKKKERRR